MVKKNGLVITMSIVLILSILNVFLFVNTGDFSYNTFTGRFIHELPDLPLNLNISLIAFAIQWIILLVLAVLAYVRYARKNVDEHLKISYSQLSKGKGRFETDFDIFYKLIQKRKKMRINSIAKTFEITEDQALEWSKILESSNLVTIEYPAFYEPEVRIKEMIISKNKKEVKNEKEVDKKGKEAGKGKTKEQEEGREKKEERGEKSEKKGKEKKEEGIFKKLFKRQTPEEKESKEKSQGREITKEKGIKTKKSLKKQIPEEKGKSQGITKQKKFPKEKFKTKKK